MDLSYDWRVFQSVFLGVRSQPQNGTTCEIEPIYLVSDKQVVLVAFCQGEDLSDWVGCMVAEKRADMRYQTQKRAIIEFERHQVDHWILDSLNSQHYDEQLEFMKKRVLPVTGKSVFDAQKKQLRHFLLKMFVSRWSKFFPRVYGIFLRLENPCTVNLFLMVRSGKLELFHEPDLGSLLELGDSNPAEVIKYLKTKYLIPVLGIFTTWDVWKQWTVAKNPWPLIFQAYRRGQIYFQPMKWVLLIWLKFMAIFPQSTKIG